MQKNSLPKNNTSPCVLTHNNIIRFTLQHVLTHNLFLLNKSAFTLGVRDFSVESPNIMLVIYKLKPTYHEDFMLS
jgi:hypothetical protein